MSCNEKVNRSIQCSVSNCSYHCNDENYCTLNEIRVGAVSGNAHPTDCKETECASFRAGTTN
jgi:hypothetical protein